MTQNSQKKECHPRKLVEAKVDRKELTALINQVIALSKEKPEKAAIILSQWINSKKAS
jgi:flagellar biosynthesis/type III secretory pathway M-ring protein FliF/YscJ